MKHIKLFEAKLHRSNAYKQKAKTIEYIDSLKQKWAEADEMSYVTFDEFFNKLPFNFRTPFSPNSDVSSCGISCPENTLSFQSLSDLIGIHYLTSDLVETPKHFKKDTDWIKRNSFLFIAVNTSGYSGGSCFNEVDEGAESYYTGKSADRGDFLKFLKVWITEILHPYPNINSIDSIIEIIDKSDSIKSGSYTDYEYYGNSDTYDCYYITLYDLWWILSQNDCL